MQRRGRPLASLDTSDLELLVSPFAEVLRQRVGVTLALRNEHHPVVIGLVFEVNLDVPQRFPCEVSKCVSVFVVDVNWQLKRALIMVDS